MDRFFHDLEVEVTVSCQGLPADVLHGPRLLGGRVSPRGGNVNPSIAALSCEVEKARLESTHLKKIIGRRKGCRMMLDGRSSGMFLTSSSRPGVLRKESAALRPAEEALILYACHG